MRRTRSCSTTAGRRLDTTITSSRLAPLHHPRPLESLLDSNAEPRFHRGSPHALQSARRFVSESPKRVLSTLREVRILDDAVQRGLGQEFGVNLHGVVSILQTAEMGSEFIKSRLKCLWRLREVREVSNDLARAKDCRAPRTHSQHPASTWARFPSSRATPSLAHGRKDDGEFRWRHSHRVGW